MFRSGYSVSLCCSVYCLYANVYRTVLLPPGVNPIAGNEYRVEQRKRMFFRWLVLGKCGVDDVGREPADSSDNAVSVAMAHWNGERRVFAAQQFFF